MALYDLLYLDEPWLRSLASQREGDLQRRTLQLSSNEGGGKQVPGNGHAIWTGNGSGTSETTELSVLDDRFARFLTLLCRKLFHSDRSVRIGWNELRIRRRRAAPVDRILLGNRRCAQQQDPARVVRDVRAGAPGQRREEERGADRGHGDGGPGGVRAGPPPAAAFPAR